MLTIKHERLWLKVSSDDSLGMEVSYGGGHILGDASRLFLSQLTIHDDPIEETPTRKLLKDKVDFELVSKRLVDFDDVWMV